RRRRCLSDECHSLHFCPCFCYSSSRWALLGMKGRAMNGLCLHWEVLALQLRNPFRLSYGVTETRQAYWIRLRDDAGWGEGTIPPYYRVDASAMIECWERAAKQTLPFPDDIDEIPHWLPEGPAPARSALELALADRIAKLRGVPL